MGVNSFEGLVNNVIDILNIVVWLAIAVGLLVFMYGIFGYLRQSGNEEKRKESIQYMINGIIGLFVMVAVWGLVNLVAGIIGETASIPYIR